MQIKKNTKVKVQYRPELGTGAVLQVAEAPEDEYGELSNSKTDLLPHQILLTHQIVSANRRRFLIADEVGLGKTIEVGMHTI